MTPSNRSDLMHDQVYRHQIFVACQYCKILDIIMDNVSILNAWWSRVAPSTCLPCLWHTVMCTCDIYFLCTLQFKDCLGHALIDSQHEVRLPEVSDYYYTDTDTNPPWTSKHGLVLGQKAILSWVITSTPTPQIPNAVPILPPPPSMHIVDWFGRLFYHWCHPAVQSTEHAGSPVHHWGGWDAHHACRLFSRAELFIHMC